jgi:hypothetical protein
MLLAFPALSISLERDYVQGFAQACWGALSCLLQLTLSCFLAIWLSVHCGEVPGETAAIHLAVLLVQLVATTFLLCAYLSFPRQPDMLCGDKPVDRQYTVSLFSRLSFSWPRPLIDWISENPNVRVEDLPLMDHPTRSETLTSELARNAPKGGSLLKRIYFAHYPTFMKLWTLGLLDSALGFVPQLALYYILQALERRNHEPTGFQGWSWALVMAAGLILSRCTNPWLDWISDSQVGLRVQAQLSAATFAKAMRRKDTKGSGKVVFADDAGHGDAATSNPESDEDDADTDSQHTHQETINLIGIDA